MHKINHFGRVSRVKEEHDDIDRASSEIVSGISHGILGASRTRPRAKARAWRNLDQLPTHSLTQALHLRGYDPKGPDGIFEEDPSAISYSYTAKINIDNISKAIKETVMSSPTELVRKAIDLCICTGVIYFRHHIFMGGSRISLGAEPLVLVTINSNRGIMHHIDTCQQCGQPSIYHHSYQ